MKEGNFMSVDFNKMRDIFSNFSDNKKRKTGNDVDLNDIGQITQLFANAMNNDLKSLSEKELLSKIADDVFRDDFDNMLELDRPEFDSYEDLLTYTKNRGQSLYYSRSNTIFSYLEKETYDSYPVVFQRDNFVVISPEFSGNHDQIESEVKLKLSK